MIGFNLTPFLKILVLTLALLGIQGCGEAAKKQSIVNTGADTAPVASDITPDIFNENTQSIITLSYTDEDSDKATNCTVSTLVNINVTQACACNGSGVCTVGVTGTTGYTGAASFNYTVKANDKTSNIATATLTITQSNNAPVADNITPASFDEETQSIITLSYTDTDGDQALSCSTSGLSNVTVTQACACAAGVCTVGVTGTSNYDGAASFNYTVTANAQVSNSATATLTIDNVEDLPVASNISPASFAEDAESIITLSYTDGDSDLATACSVSNLTNVTETDPCSCDGAGVCTVGITGTSGYSGSASFTYTVTTNGTASNSATATLNITIVADLPVADDLTPPAFDEDTESIISLSYTDQEGDVATSCALSNLVKVTVSQPCACAAGVCTVGVTGTSNSYGSASFDYTVTANGQTSAAATASLTINPISDAVDLDVNFFPVQSLILPSDADAGDTVSDVSSSYYIFHNANPVYSIVSNTADNNFSISAAGVITVDAMTNLTAGQSYNITVRAEDAAKMLYDEKVISIAIIDSSNIIYIDPTHAGVESGTRAQPYNTWAEAKAVMTNGKYLLQKRGTTETMNSFSINVNDLTMGAYGAGARPILNMTVNAGTSLNAANQTGIIIRDLYLIGASATGPVVAFGANTSGNQTKLLNSKIEGGSTACVTLTSTTNMLIQNNEIFDCLYSGISTTTSITSVEIAYNYIHHVNQQFNVDPATATGRSIVFNTAITSVDVNHNIMDRTDTGKSYCLFTTGTMAAGSFNYNYCKAANATFKAINAGYTIIGISFELASATAANIQFIGNKFDDLEYGYRLKKISSAQIQANEFTDNFIPVRFGTDSGGVIYNNLFKDAGMSAVVFGDTSSETVVSKNNIFDFGGSIYMYYGTLARLTTSNYNLFAHGVAMSGYADFTAWKATGHDANTVVGTPNYFNEAGSDFHIVDDGSPGLSLGQNLGLTSDIEEQAYPATPHAGPYQSLK